MAKNVYVLTRISDGDVVVDGVFTTELKAEEYKTQLMEEFGVEDDDDSNYNWEIHHEILS
jgi:hypothetical protein